LKLYTKNGRSPICAALVGDDKDWGHSIRPNAALGQHHPMHPALQPCLWLIEIARTLIAGVRFFDFSHTADYVPTQAAAQRIKAGLKLAEAYLRRVLILMALALEPTLVDVPQKGLERRRHEKAPRIVVRQSANFIIFPPVPALPDKVLDRLRELDEQARFEENPPRRTGYIYIGNLKARLEQLAKIATDPTKRVNRLAMYIARKKHGPFFAPDRHIRPSNQLGRLRKLWDTKTSASFDAMAYNIITRSRERPPPLAPRQKYGPSILSVGG
jgi:hypothetical protein